MDENGNLYDKDYFKSHCGMPYTRENFLPLFQEIARHIVKDLNPKTVLDAGCAMGYLVESLRDLGVEAYGFDISDYAISQVRDDIKKFIKKQSIFDPIDKQYDLIVCIEVLEHLSEKNTEIAIENLCNGTSTILFSSTPVDKTEPTHQNVQDTGYWASQFARFGFLEQVDHDLSYVNSHAMIFKKVEKIQNLDIIKSYSNKLWLLKNLRLQQERKLWQRENQLKQYEKKIEQLQNSINEITTSTGYSAIQKFRYRWNKKFPLKSRRRKYADALVLRIFGDILGVKKKESNNDLKNKFIQLFSLPVDTQYKIWLENHNISKNEANLSKMEIDKFKIKPKISIIMPVHNIKEIWLRAAIDSVRNQFYDNWEVCIVDDASNNNLKPILEEYAKLDGRIKVQYLLKNLGIAGASNKAIESSTGDYVGFLDHDDCIYQDALFEIVKRINEKPDAELLYSDEDKIDTDGQRVDPYFKPDWSPDLLLTGNYITHFCVLHNSLIKELKGFRLGYDGSQDYDLFLRATDIPRKIEHIPKVLYGWRKTAHSASSSMHNKPNAYSASLRALQDTMNRRNVKGVVEQVEDTLFYRIRYDFGNPLVSIILMTTSDATLLQKCIKSIEKTSYKNFELIIIDNSSSEGVTNLLKSSRYKIVKTDAKSNNSAVYNVGACHANGNILLFLSDAEPISGDWLESMLESSSPDKVGIVGPMLLASYDSSKPPYFIANAGTVIGVGGIASDAFAGLPAQNLNYRGVSQTIRNCSAVSGRCMLVKKKIFDMVGGWDEKIEQHNDIDLCLRISEKGYRIVYTPYAKLLQHKVSGGAFADDFNFISKWKNRIFNPDPFYNVNLSQTAASYAISPYSNFPKPIAIMMEIYLNREDLQDKFPEAKEKNFGNLLKWVLESGLEDDFSFYALRPFEDELEQFYNLLEKREHLNSHITL